jgi:type VI secretion system protein ImpH
VSRDGAGNGTGKRSSPAAATADWTGVAARLLAAPYEFDFFQAVRLLQRLIPDRTAIGRGGPPWREPVRFRAHVSTSFPPSSIHDLAVPPGEQTPVMTQSFLGLFGPSGILPRSYTELLIRLQRDSKGPEKHLLREWMDLFNHRLVSLFYRAWEKYRFTIPYERLEYDRSEPDLFTRSLLSLIGLGMPPLRQRLRVSAEADPESAAPEVVFARILDLSLLRYAGFFSHRPRNAISLQALIGDYFRTPTQVRQFQGQWLPLEPSVQSQLGEPAGNNELGASAVAGDRVWNTHNKIRLRLGPLDYARFIEFLPDTTPVFQRKDLFLLIHMVRFYLGPDLDFDIQLVLRAEDVPEAVLTDDGSIGARLGWNTWMREPGCGDDADDAVFPGIEVFSLG